MRCSTKTLLVLALAVPFLVSCRALVSETQRMGIHSSDSSGTIDGAQLTLSSQIEKIAKGKTQFDLKGTLTVAAVDGELPVSIDLYHFSLRAAKTGYYVQNFSRAKDGSWRHAGGTTTGAVPRFHAVVKRDAQGIVLTFEWKEIGGGWLDNPSSYDRVDVSVSLTDAAGKRHILSNLAVPTSRRGA